MTEINETISGIGMVPVIKLSNPERDAAPLAKALCAGGVPVTEVTFRAAGKITASPEITTCTLQTVLAAAIPLAAG